MFSRRMGRRRRRSSRGGGRKGGGIAAALPSLPLLGSPILSAVRSGKRGGPLYKGLAGVFKEPALKKGKGGGVSMWSVFPGVKRSGVRAAASSAAAPVKGVFDESVKTGTRSALPRRKPRDALEDWMLTGGRWGAVSRELYRAAYRRQKLEEEIRLKLAEHGITFEEFSKVARKLKSGKKLSPEEEEIVAKLGWGWILEKYEAHKEEKARESEYIAARESMERGLVYETAHPDEIIKKRVREAVAAAPGLLEKAVVTGGRVAEEAGELWEAARRGAERLPSVVEEVPEKVGGAVEKVKAFIGRLRRRRPPPPPPPEASPSASGA